jgi:hypothetical protein
VQFDTIPTNGSDGITATPRKIVSGGIGDADYAVYQMADGTASKNAL